MMVHIGANGNVFAYNYSMEPQSEADWLPCDISIHGHYPHYNLFEGNIVNEVGIADYWGPAGPDNTYFRNAVLSENLYAEDSSQYQNIIGNYIEPGTFTYNQDTRWPANVDLSTYILHGNWSDGQINWDPAIANHNLPASYYYTTKLSFYDSLAWPSVGAEFPGGGTNPAKERWLAGKPIPDTTPLPTTSPGLRGDINGSGDVSIVDALLVARFCAGLNPAPFVQANADVSCNGGVEIVDALLIARYCAGLISGFC